MRKLSSVLCVIVCAVGCSDGGVPRGGFASLKGALSQIEGSVDDMYNTVMSADFAYTGNLDDDRLGIALNNFSKAAQGTAFAADAEELSKKVTALGELAATNPPIDKLRAAVTEVQQSVANLKSRL